MSDEKQCPKCKGELIRGFVGDYSEGSVYVPGWHAGPPKKSFWSGTKAWRSEGIPVGAFRCQKCGFLEFFANSEFEAQ